MHQYVLLNRKSCLQVLGWRILDEEVGLKLQCLWKLRDFKCGVELVNRIYKVTESCGHFPNVHLEQNQVRAELWTESLGKSFKIIHNILFPEFPSRLYWISLQPELNDLFEKTWILTIFHWIAGGLSMTDFIVAAKIDEIKTSDLVPRKRVWA